MYQNSFRSVILSVLCGIMILPLSAQIEFQSNEQYFDPTPKGLFAIGMTDLNSDYHDDILLVPDANSLNVYYQSGSSAYAKRENVISGFPSMITTITTGDLDKDGYDEILLSGVYDGTHIYGFDGEHYVRDTLLTESVFAQGSNAVDVNNDGYLDFFICHDEANNVIYINDGSGTLNYDVSNLILPVDITVDNSGNYGSEWIDFDDDGDLDLYISKCRLGVVDTNDIRRKNALYVNDGAGIYTEQADAYGLGSGWQSWLSQWGDVDNDGDLDLLVLNHDYYHQLFRNEEGEFVEDTLFADMPIMDVAFQGIMQDYDNDGDLDVLVCGSLNYMLWNDGLGNFTQDDNPFGPVDAYSGAVGDFNADGFLDVAVVNVGFIRDRIYESVGNENNYVKISLNGIISNKDGIGASVFVHGPWGMQRRDVKAGESYGIVNSSAAHFGLSQNTSIDSVIVKWPSGIRDKFIPSEVNTQYVITEGQCMEPIAPIVYEGDLSLCGEDSIVLRSSVLSPDIVWSEGSVGVSEIIVHQEGTYSYKIVDPNDGCVIQSELVYISEFPEREPLRIVSSGDPITCNQSILELSVGLYDSIAWSTGDSLNVVEVEEAGWYFTEVNDICSGFQRDSIFVSRLDPQLPVTMGDSLLAPGNADLLAMGDSLQWYADQNSLDVIFTGSLFSPFVEETTSYYVSNIQAELQAPESLGEKTHLGQTLYSNDAVSAGMEFIVHSACTIKSIDVYSDKAGVRTINLSDALSQTIASYAMYVPAGEWITIPVNFKMETPGQFLLSTDEDINLENLGHLSPRFVRSFEVPLHYPYVLDEALEIRNSTFGSEYYYYFYNWQIEKPALTCETDRVEVVAYVDDDVAIDEVDTEGIIIYPNPFSGPLIIELPEGLDYKHYAIKDISGRSVGKGLLYLDIDLSDLERGTYFLELYDDINGKVSRKKIIKIN